MWQGYGKKYKFDNRKNKFTSQLDSRHFETTNIVLIQPAKLPTKARKDKIQFIKNAAELPPRSPDPNPPKQSLKVNIKASAHIKRIG